MMVDATNQRDLQKASASCVGVMPYFCAMAAYSATASLASDLLKRSIYPDSAF